MRLIVLFVVLALVGCAKQAAPVVSCAALTQGCALDQDKLFVKTDRAPTPLKPFALTVRAPVAQAVNVEVQMQGMEMGLNRYRLIRQANGEWRATITLPVCVTGRRDWLMLIEVDGVRRGLTFQTE
ncbi:MAG: hypothetical protein IV108_08925 [Burkholderiales bacterium]|nr:hypothetical protein [Burkholderiales bacterium]